MKRKLTALLIFIGMIAITRTALAGEIHRCIINPDQKRVLEILKRTPSQLNARDSQGNTPLILSAAVGNHSMTNLFIARGAEVNLTNKQGESALHGAALIGSEPVAEALIKAGAKLNLKNSRGNTPLHLAASSGSIEVAEVLLKNKANPKIKNKAGKTPADLAKKEGYQKLTEILKSSEKTSVSNPKTEKFTGSVNRKVSCSYLLFTPENRRDKMPLILFLHGSGERGDNPAHLASFGPFVMAEKDKNFPFMIAAPVCPVHSDWDPETLIALVEHLKRTLPVDGNRIYLTGMSMGGHGAWNLAARRPDLFAAVAPVSGWGPVYLAHRFKTLPVWTFHGAKDKIIPPDRTRKMADAINENGGRARLTIYPDRGHNAWTPAYSNRELYNWFLSQKKTGSR